MTSLNIQLASALSRTWGVGDEVVVTRLDHDGNVRPWALAAEWSGATLRKIDVDPKDCTLDMESVLENITENTVLVALGLHLIYLGQLMMFERLPILLIDLGQKLLLMRYIMPPFVN